MLLIQNISLHMYRLFLAFQPPAGLYLDVAHRFLKNGVDTLVVPDSILKFKTSDSSSSQMYEAYINAQVRAELVHCVLLKTMHVREK